MTLHQFTARMHRAAEIVRRIIGVPDYETYLAHHTRCHPDHPPLTREDFSRQALKDKYARPGTRCC